MKAQFNKLKVVRIAVVRLVLKSLLQTIPTISYTEDLLYTSIYILHNHLLTYYLFLFCYLFYK